jgi:hypothetical protein
MHRGGNAADRATLGYVRIWWCTVVYVNVQVHSSVWLTHAQILGLRLGSRPYDVHPVLCNLLVYVAYNSTDYTLIVQPCPCCCVCVKSNAL